MYKRQINIIIITIIIIIIKLGPGGSVITGRLEQSAVASMMMGELSARGVAKYSDFGPIEGYMSDTVQERRFFSIHH